MQANIVPVLLDLELFYKLIDKDFPIGNHTRTTTPFGFLRRATHEETLSAIIFETDSFDLQLVQEERVLFLDITLKKPFEKVRNLIVFGLVIGDIIYIGCLGATSRLEIVSLNLQLEHIKAPRNLDKICKKIIHNYRHFVNIGLVYECGHGLRQEYGESWSPLNQVCEVGTNFICFLRGESIIDIYCKVPKKRARLKLEPNILAILGDYRTRQLLYVNHSHYNNRNIYIMKLSPEEDGLIEGETDYIFMRSTTKKVRRIFKLFCQIYQLKQLSSVLRFGTHIIYGRCYCPSVGVDKEHIKYLMELHSIFNKISSHEFPKELTQKIFWLMA